MADSTVKLKRNVGLITGIAFNVGSTIGSGIFISPKGVLKETGSVGLSLIVWTAGGIISLCGALSYAELGTLIPKSGGEYAYTLEATFPVVAYLFIWTKILVLQPSITAICSLSFASYLTALFDLCGAPVFQMKLIAVLMIFTLGIINSYDTSWAAYLQVWCTATKVIALTIIIVGGFVKLGQGGFTKLQDGFKGTTNSPTRIASSFYDAMNTLNTLTEELKEPYKNLPRVNVFGILLVTLIYILTNASYIVVLGADKVLVSDAVAMDWGKKVLGSGYLIVQLGVLFTIFGSTNGACFSSGRIVYSAAREGHLPEILSYVHVKRYTPLPSLIATCFMAILMVIPSNINSLIDFFEFTSWLFYGIAVSCLLILRIRRPNAKRPFKVFILIPIVFVLCSIYLVIAPIIQDPRLEFLYAFLFIIGGLVFYFPFVVFKLDKGRLDKVTTTLQLLMNTAPSPYIPEHFE